MSVKDILQKAANGERITPEEGILLYKEAKLSELGAVAHEIRCRKTDPKRVTYLVDRNINYTNVCITNCKFCNFYRTPNHNNAYVLTREQLATKIEETLAIGGTRILMQGGHHPDLRLSWYKELLEWLRETYPAIELDCFSPSEIDHICVLEDMSPLEVLKELKESGLRGLPGGGAEILDDEIRQVVSPKKISGDRWIEIMGVAQSLELHTSASMVIGLGESIKHRIRHFSMLRDRQDKSLKDYNNGFIAFIAWPLQFEFTPLGKQSQNKGKLGAGATEYLRNLAIARIFLDNFSHFQSSWPTMGFQVAQVALEFGADDFGSTMLEENVVSQASSTTHCNVRVEEIRSIIQSAGYEYAQRDTAYEIVAN